MDQPRGGLDPEVALERRRLPCVRFSTEGGSRGGGDGQEKEKKVSPAAIDSIQCRCVRARARAELVGGSSGDSDGGGRGCALAVSGGGRKNGGVGTYHEAGERELFPGEGGGRGRVAKGNRSWPPGGGGRVSGCIPPVGRGGPAVAASRSIVGGENG